jgi:hypothetical protein
VPEREHLVFPRKLRNVSTTRKHLPEYCGQRKYSARANEALMLKPDGVYRGADKSLARPGRKQARKHVRDARGFNNIETRGVKFFSPPVRQGAEGNSRHSDRNISVFPSWLG